MKRLAVKNGVARVGHGLALGGLADEALTRLGKCDHGRASVRATLRIGNHHRFPAFHDGHAGIGGA